MLSIRIVLGLCMEQRIPSAAFLVFCEDEIVKSSAGPRFAMYFTITPVAERFSIAWTYVARDYGGMSDEQTRQFQKGEC
jgi:hypothetical protein